MNDYTPQVGSLVDKLLRHLVLAGPGKDFTAAELEAATGVHNSAIQASLWSPIRRGFVKQTNRTGPPARNAWGITAEGMAALCGQPEAVANGADAEPAAGSGNGGVTAEEERALLVDLEEHMNAAGTAGWTADPPADVAFACALYSDGRFHVETSDGESFTLQRDDTRQLLAYLELLRVGDSAAVAQDPAARAPAQ